MRRCLGSARTGRQCRATPRAGRLFCRRHQHQGVQAWGGPADGCQVLVETLADVPFTARRDAAGLQLHRLGAGGPADGYYALTVHPVTARPCARWRGASVRPSRQAVPDATHQNEDVA